MTEENAPGSAPMSVFNKAVQATVVAAMAAGMVLAGAAFSAWMFDRLPTYLDVLFVVFVLPFLLLIGALLFDAKVITPRYPSWLRREDGREVQLPGLLVGAVLAASIAAIYPGMFPAKTYANLALKGAALEVQPATAPRNAAYYGFRGSSLRVDLGGSRRRRVVRSDGNYARSVIRVTHAVPIVSRGWTPLEPVVAWAISEEEHPPWSNGTPRFIEGVRLPDVRGHALRAVELTAEKRALEVVREPILIEFGETYDALLQTSRFWTWLVLGPLCLFVFAATGAKTWFDLNRD